MPVSEEEEEFVLPKYSEAIEYKARLTEVTLGLITVS